MKRPRETEEESFSSSQEILQSVEAAADRPTSLAVKLGIASSPRSRTASPALSSTTATDGPAPITITQGYDEHTGRTTSASEAPRSKIIELDLSSDTTDPNSHLDDGNNNIMKCSLPGHKYPVRFSSYEEYETHYTKNHTNQCRECRKNFPSEHLLGLHIEEVHDSFLAVKRDRGDKTVSIQVPLLLSLFPLPSSFFKFLDHANPIRSRFPQTNQPYLFPLQPLVLLFCRDL